MSQLADRLVATLPQCSPGLFNPYVESCEHDIQADAPAERLARLRNHLDCDARLILVGEAPGYQGCRYTGVPFTSERLLLNGEIPRVSAPAERLTSRRLPFSEPSATIVWKTLKALGAESETVLWNAVQLHPFRAGNVWSNRTPSKEEVALGIRALQLMERAFPRATFVPIGKKAERLLAEAGIRASGYVRHPANGGATEFAKGLSAIG